jgi:hypothetical protein
MFLLLFPPAATHKEAALSKETYRHHFAYSLVLAAVAALTGCGSVNDQWFDSATEQIKVSSTLPAARVDKAYAATISVTGGSPPYRFFVSSGELPTGLVLNHSSGEITGVPQDVGSFSFAVRVVDKNRFHRGGRPLRLHVLAASRHRREPTINVSPGSASLASLVSQQFTALVRGTSQTDVTWSASAGTISNTGLFTAPAVNSPMTITVTATSVANSQLKGSSLITVTASTTEPSSKPIIKTTSLPLAVADSGYTTNLSATGGQLPYRWDVVSGALPAGIQFNSSDGKLTGTAHTLGRFPFTAKITDNAGNTAQQALDLVVSSADACGPPTYPCSRSDTALIIPTAPPQLGADPSYYGGHSGAGMVATDPAYGNRILRVTDGNTTSLGMSFDTPSSADKNITSYDETLFFVTDEGNNPCLFQFDQSGFTTKFRGCFHNVGVSSAEFGYTATNNNVFFNYAGHKLYRFVVNTTSWTISPDPTFNNGVGYFDADGPECLNGQIAANHWFIHGTGLSSDDSTVIASIGPLQDRDPYIVVWNAAKGCQWMNVQTWQVSQGWNTGLSNPVNVTWASGKGPTWPGGVHNVKLDRSGQYGVLTLNINHKVFWNIGTNAVNDTCAQCQSHWTCDYGVCFWRIGLSQSGFLMRDIAIAEPFMTDMHHVIATPDMDVSSAIGQWSEDEHASHANAEPGLKNIYLVGWQPAIGGSTVKSVWGDEIIGVNWDGSQRTIRFNKSWTSGYSFQSTARCPISRKGNYALCPSDYQIYNLDKGFGNGKNQDTCDHRLATSLRGTNGCRIDVLLFELR